MSVVHICAPGPSLNWDWEWEGQTIICINRALLDAPACDYWCCIDKPRKPHEDCQDDAARLKPTIVTKPRRVGLWGKFAPGCEVVNAQKKYTDSWVAQLPAFGTQWSMVFAVAWATHVLGSKEIHFHGVDMEGVGYHDGSNPMETNELRWKKRWKTAELYPMHNLWLESKRHGVKLVGLPDKVTVEPPGFREALKKH